ncbi:putative protein kinase RLK-Pelle-DLSV family [Rosa chinensis]|uniref:non-specific serine/threonine protein kinase n=1 Tax=Rosa chinensis TaxID=74649 RepID=A0A2P6Q8F2_ROSCH|nr:putative protein kinase RLK-Pelle-DLSV family [Rosa chinensis]
MFQLLASTAHKWIWIGAAGLLVMVLCILCYLLRRDPATPGNFSNIIDFRDLTNEIFLFNILLGLGPPNDRFMGDDLKVFSYESVMAATDNFSGENKLGEGGFGPVYKGSMPTGQEIAVKTLSSGSVQGEVEFKNELILISELQHINLVQLFGYCIHGIMVKRGYSTSRMLLDWKKRFNIIEGIAQGLLYLHKYSISKVIHRDLKASNILLDENMYPKISDFVVTCLLAEYAMQGFFSEKSDVFSFGVLMLEIISGRKNNSFHTAHRALNLVGYDPGLRPTMSDAISMLTIESLPLPIPTRPASFPVRNSAGVNIRGNESEKITENGLSDSLILGR